MIKFFRLIPSTKLVLHYQIQEYFDAFAQVDIRHTLLKLPTMLITVITVTTISEQEIERRRSIINPSKTLLKRLRPQISPSLMLIWHELNL